MNEQNSKIIEEEKQHDLNEAKAYLDLHSKTRHKTGQRRENHKSSEQRKEDVAYTLNHALTCTVTDFIDPFLGAYGQEHFGEFIADKICRQKKPSLPGTSQKDEGTFWQRYKIHLKEWVGGEFVGDFGAVPFTIAMQRYAPNFMNSLGEHILEPVIGGVFKNSANEAATKWAGEHNVELGSKDFNTYRDYHYKYEVDHLPQAAMWTASSIVLNIAAQKKIFGSQASACELTILKSVGAGITAATVFGGRTIFPDKARKLDKWTNSKIIEPATKLANNTFKIKTEDGQLSHTEKYKQNHKSTQDLTI